MMRGLRGEQVLMRIFVGEKAKHEGTPLYKALVELFRKEKLAGATVLRGTMGYGARSHLHTADLLTLSQDLPLIIEVVDSQENIDRVLPVIDAIIEDGLVTMEKVQVLRYRPGVKIADR